MDNGESVRKGALLTIFTPTYNRAYILESLYRSIQRQTFRDFEWLIVDDGSTDNTETLVDSWIHEGNDFPIRYYKQSNGGKCRAINRALDLAEGELFFVVDSDDILTRDALEKISRWEGELPNGRKYCAVAGKMENAEEKPSEQSPEERYYEGDLLDRYRNVEGEKIIAFYTDIHRKYKYPLFENEKFMTEAVAWNRMAHDGYKTRFYNDVICIYEYHEDGLTKAGKRLFLENPRGYALWLREKDTFLGHGPKGILHLWYIYYNELSFCEEKYRLTKKQIAEYLDAPLLGIYAMALAHSIASKLRKKGCR